jgi:hypothetical protein
MSITSITVAKEKALQIIDCIKNGASEADAVILSDVSESDYRELRVKFPKVAVIIDKAKIEYKYKIISKMNTMAANGDMKAVNWIAENSPAFGEYAKKKGFDPNSPNENPLIEAFRYIQNNSKPLVKSPKK